MNFTEMLAGSLQSEDEADGRQYGFIKGIVTDVNDPLAQGRCKARIGAQYAGESSDWLTPAWTGGYEGIPILGDTIYVGFFDGDPNRGIYFCTTSSTSQRRATEAAVLGTTFVGMFNYLVTQFNQLRSDYNSHTHLVSSISAGVASVTSAGPALTDASTGKLGMAWDGSTVPSVGTSKQVLSDIAMVRGGDSPPMNGANPLIPPRFIKTDTKGGA